MGMREGRFNSQEILYDVLKTRIMYTVQGSKDLRTLRQMGEKRTRRPATNKTDL
jgi:hypothetical protein